MSSMRSTAAFVAALSGMLAACHAGRADAFVTGAAGPAVAVEAVRVSALPPRNAREIAIVQAVGQAPLEDLVETFKAKVASVGGARAVVDDVHTKFEIVTYTESYSYNCGTTQSPRTCTGSRLASREVATTVIDGRAFRETNEP
jgi:hypothetical protein